MTRRVAAWVIASAAVALTLAAIATAGIIWWYRAPGLSTDPVALEQEILTLRAERDSLQARQRAAGELDVLLARRPEGDLVLALPVPFVEALARDIAGGWFSAVDLRLRNLTVRKAGDVNARLGLLGRRRVGRYALRLKLTDVRGRLEPGTPVLSFTGDRIDLALPVRLTGGQGTGRAAFEWDSRGLARGVCGDLEAERAIDGTVAPADYLARGYLKLSASDGGLIVDPRFPGLSMRLMVRPSRQSVAALEEVLSSRGKLCNFAVEQARVEERILALVGRGFEVKIPQRFFRPVRLPVAIDGAMPIVGTTLLLTATPDTLVVTPQAVWLAARVAIRGAVKGKTPSGGGTAPPR